MNYRVRRVTTGLRELIQPYLCKQECGNLRGIDREFTGEHIGWFLNYEKILGSTVLIDAYYIRKRDDFVYAPSPHKRRVKAKNPETVLAYFKREIDLIKPERLRDLRKNARMKKKQGIPLETAIAEMREFAKRNYDCGPTDEELQQYERFCREIFAN